jgi:hypothetical protein
MLLFVMVVIFQSTGLFNVAFFVSLRFGGFGCYETV